MSMAGNPMTGLMARYLGDRVSKKKKATAAPQAIGTPVDETAYGAMPQVNPMAKLAAAAAAGAAGGAVAAPLATQDPAAEEAMRREVMRQVEQTRVAALMDSDKALRMRRAELAQLNRAGVRGPEVAAAYADINKLDNDYNQSRTRLTELRNLSRRTAYDQGEQAFNAGQNRLLEDYRAGGAPVAGETVGPLQAGREFFRPRQFNDPEIVARRAELEREKAIGQASPTLDLEMRAVREGLAGQRAVQDRLAAERGAYESNTADVPNVAADEITNAARRRQLEKVQLGKQIIDTQIDTPPLEAARLKKSAQNVEAVAKSRDMVKKAIDDDADKTAGFDSAGFEDRMARYLTEYKTKIKDFDSQQASDFFDEMEAELASLGRLAQLQPERAAAIAQRYAKEFARMEPPRTFSDRFGIGEYGPRTALKKKRWSQMNQRFQDIAAGKTE